MLFIHNKFEKKLAEEIQESNEIEEWKNNNEIIISKNKRKLINRNENQWEL